jgi:hypothetical protein
MSEEQVAEQSEQVAPTTEQSGKSWVDVEGNFTEGFRANLPDGLGDHSFLDKFKSVPDLVKWGVNANKLIGKKGEEFWTSEDPELVERRKEIMGVPKSASEYEYDSVEMPDGLPAEAINGRIEQFKEFAKDLGLSKEQAKKAIEWDLQGAVEQFNSMQEAQHRQMKIAEEDLRKEWKGDKYEYNLAKVGEALDYLGIPQFKDNPAIANDPSVIKALYEKIVPLIDNDTLVESRQYHNPASMNDRLTELEDSMLAYDGRSSDGKYQAMVKERNQLLEKFKN